MTKTRREKFMKILRVEIEDAKEDIELFIECLKEDHEKGKVSNYVFNSNVGILQNELLGIDDVLKELNNINPTDYKDFHALADAIEKYFEDFFTRHALIKAGFILVKNKIERVRGYIEKDL